MVGSSAAVVACTGHACLGLCWEFGCRAGGNPAHRSSACTLRSQLHRVVTRDPFAFLVVLQTVW